MTCFQIQELLSAYYDGELSSDIRADVAAHVHGCAECSGRVTAFAQLSAAARDLPPPSPPPEIWNRLERELDAGSGARPAASQRMWALSSRRFVAIAASLLVAVGAGWFALTWHQHHQHSQMAANLGRYLETFQRNPAEAQQLLLASFEGEAVTVAEAARVAGYRPVVAGGLPESYSLDSVYVLNMPCCTCVQTLCKRKDGSTLVIIEHGTDQPVRFGGCPCVSAECGGKQCDVVQGDSQLAATWSHQGRRISVIGARGMEEVSALMKWLEHSPSA